MSKADTFAWWGIAVVAMLLVAGSLFTSCAAPNPASATYSVTDLTNDPRISILHDRQHRVTCWLYTTSGYYGNGAGISCLPDAQVWQTIEDNLD